LARANYRTANYRQALEAAMQAKHYGGPQYYRVGFIQAMALWQLGEKEKARNCYQEAARLAENHLGNEILCLERDEAAALLGIKERSVAAKNAKEGLPAKH
jgi:tetratricopeptide (TPR) repeat protein